MYIYIYIHIFSGPWKLSGHFRYASVIHVSFTFPSRFRCVSVNVSITVPLGNSLPDKKYLKTPATPTKTAMTKTAVHKTKVRKTAVRKAAMRKAAVRKTGVRKPAARKAAMRKAAARKAAVRKAAVRKAAVRKAALRKAAIRTQDISAQDNTEHIKPARARHALYMCVKSIQTSAMRELNPCEKAPARATAQCVP